MSLRKISLAFAALALMTFSRCNTKSDAGSSPFLTGNEGKLTSVEVPDELVNNCYICHNPNASSHDAIIAPPLAVVKRRYNRQFETKEAFIEGMTDFLLNPTKEKAIMFGAVDRFGLMPKTALDETTIREIAEYVYSNKLDEPHWLKEQGESRMRP
jgi:hypothetical protein